MAPACPRRTVCSSPACGVRRLTIAGASKATSATAPLYSCPVDAEPLHLYRPGGYHPVQLGALLHDKRYKILHKLGWGSYSTVWAARDRRNDVYVAIKIKVSDRDGLSQELPVMEKLAARGSAHIMQLLDNFDIEGPNGKHECLVTELLGPSVPDFIESRFHGGRLPARLAISIAKQALHGLEALHQLRIGHGDLHTRNLAFKLPENRNTSESALLDMFEPPEIGRVKRSDGLPSKPGVPGYLVHSASLRRPQLQLLDGVKMVDFGQAFLANGTPKTLHTPLPVRAPEIIFGDKLDYRVDLWSMGCMLFELVVGQPPFDSLLVTKDILIQQMTDMIDDEIPERWKRFVKKRAPQDEPTCSLREWLMEMYFDDERRVDLPRADVEGLYILISRLLRFEPTARPSARNILDSSWFNRCNK